jgi:hypothetical protein
VPCVMCSLPMRENSDFQGRFHDEIALIGGFSKFGILQVAELSNLVPELLE